MKPLRADDPMTADAFLEWNQDREGHEGRWELVDGVPIRMMVGARRIHNLVTTNLVVSLSAGLHGGECDVMSSDAAVRVSDIQVRYPDVVVDCGAGEPDDLAAREPILVVEVASPSTREFDAVRKLREYQSILSIAYVLLVEPSEVDVQLYTREAGGWRFSLHQDLGEVLDLPKLGSSLALSDIYRGIRPA